MSNVYKDKKFLVISPFNIFPPYWGGASRIYNLIKKLSEQNEVILLYNDLQQVCDQEYIKGNTSKNDSGLENVKLNSVHSFQKWSQIFNPLLLLRGFYIIMKEKPDYVIAEFTWSGLHAIILKLTTGIPYILDEHNVEFLRFKRMKRGNKSLISLLKKYEQISCKYSSNVYCVSEVDKNFLISELNVEKDKIIVVPNMVDTCKFRQNQQKRDFARKELALNENTPVILFFGKLDYKPNLEAVEIIYTEILPRVLDIVTNVKFVIVGSNPPKEFDNKHILYPGLVEHIEDYINASDVVICPLISGGGTRIKILESLACGKVVISTTIGAEGITGYSDDELKILDDWAEFANSIVKQIQPKMM